MNSYFLNNDQLKCVILCAGKGDRLLPHTLKKPKVMIKIKNKPILAHVIDYWKNFTNNFIFVVGYKKNQIIDFVKKIPINSQFVEQKKLKGIADALFCAKDFVSDQFIVVLGDCMCSGEFNFPKNMEYGIGEWRTKNVNDIKRSYSLEIKNNLVVRVEEKPKEVSNNLCGAGYYFFNKKVFSCIKNTKPSKLR